MDAEATGQAARAGACVPGDVREGHVLVELGLQPPQRRFEAGVVHDLLFDGVLNPVRIELQWCDQLPGGLSRHAGTVVTAENVQTDVQSAEDPRGCEERAVLDHGAERVNCDPRMVRKFAVCRQPVVARRPSSRPVAARASTPVPTPATRIPRPTAARNAV